MEAEMGQSSQHSQWFRTNLAEKVGQSQRCSQRWWKIGREWKWRERQRQRSIVAGSCNHTGTNEQQLIMVIKICYSIKVPPLPQLVPLPVSPHLPHEPPPLLFLLLLLICLSFLSSSVSYWHQSPQNFQEPMKPRVFRHQPRLRHCHQQIQIVYAWEEEDWR